VRCCRDGENTKSTQLDDRLSTGALVEEIELKGDRLNYRLAVGTGPTTGWVFSSDISYLHYVLIYIYMYVNTITIISIISNTDLVRVLLEYALNQKILKVSQDLSTSFPPLLGFRPRREDPPWCNFSFSLLTPVAAQ